MRNSRVVGAGLSELADALAAAGLPTGDLREIGRHFWRFEDDFGLCGYGGLEGSGADLLLRSLTVRPDRRGGGLGARIATELAAQARSLGAERVHLLTTDAADFFVALGYVRADRQAAPPSIAATAQFSELCPASAAYLVKSLP